MYAYRLSNAHANSSKFGPCEVCGKDAESVFFLTEMREYAPGRITYNKCRPSVFGHKECLANLTTTSDQK